MEEDKNKTQQPPSKKEQKQEAGQKAAEVGAKAAATYFGGKVGGQVASKLLDTKAGKALTNKVGKKLAKTPGLGNNLNQLNKTGALDVANQGMDMMNSAGGPGGTTGGAAAGGAKAGTAAKAGNTNKTGASKKGAQGTKSKAGNSSSSGSSSLTGSIDDAKEKIKKIKIIIGIISACWPVIVFFVILIAILTFFFDFNLGGTGANYMCEAGNNVGWWWPVAGNTNANIDSSESPITTMTSGFGPRWGRKHSGLDISGSLKVGEYNVIASKAGTVVAIENTNCPDNGSPSSCPNVGNKIEGWGNTVKIDHGGKYTRYAHLAKGSIKVSVGDKVSQGQVLGKLGHSGNSTGAHLHFEVYEGTERVDPEDYVSPKNQRPGTTGATCAEGDFSKCLGNGIWAATAYGGHLVVEGKNFDSAKDCKYDPTYGWCLYNGKIVVAGAYTSTGSVINPDAPLRDDIYYFGENKYEVAGTELQLKINGKWYPAIMMDVCGVCINPDRNTKYRYTNYANTDWKTQVIDILYEKEGTHDTIPNVEVSLGNVVGDVCVENTQYGNTGKLTFATNNTEYKVVKGKHSVEEMVRFINKRGVHQATGYFADKCLSLAQFYAYHMLHTDNLDKLDVSKAGTYPVWDKFKDSESSNKKEAILSKIYEDINNNKPVVLQVGAGSRGNITRHYVTVVGYKSKVNSASSLTEEDLLIIDDYDGKLESMDDSGTRRMIKGTDTVSYKSNKKMYGYGYQIYRLK